MGYTAPVTFELRGAPADETRLIVHPTAGLFAAVPGHPAPGDFDGTHFALRLGDAGVEIRYRLDTLPSQTDAKALAAALALAYMTSASQQPVAPGPAAPASGAHAAATATYQRRGDDDRAMEHVSVTVKSAPPASHALYQIVRFTRGELTPLQWANLRTALAVHRDWTATPPPAAPPAVWPPSRFVAPSVKLELLPGAWQDAQDKAALLGATTAEDVASLTDLLLEFAINDDPPTHALQRVVLDLGARQIAMRCHASVAEVLLRNFYDVQTMHDLRGWCWQSLWALGNRAGLRGPIDQLA